MLTEVLGVTFATGCVDCIVDVRLDTGQYAGRKPALTRCVHAGAKPRDRSIDSVLADGVESKTVDHPICIGCLPDFLDDSSQRTDQYIVPFEFRVICHL